MLKKRNELIDISMVGLEVLVHNGKQLQPLIIEIEMVGKKYGEFIFTRKLVNRIHKEEKKK